MPDKYFIIDANIVISIAVFSSQNPIFALNKILSSGTLAFSEPVLQEYAETLSRSKFDKYVSIEKRLVFLQKLIAEGTLITVSEEIRDCRDPKDNKYLELAVSCNASCIITGDSDLLVLNPFRKIPILTPGDFITRC
ncbi:MAG: putative toxin-antitoxin system toxin component, PIN family [Bacteroidota bacterium]|nr:putative toxin-antitoxin system toxin component, PIN family [Bacteroidota bacterium]